MRNIQWLVLALRYAGCQGVRRMYGCALYMQGASVYALNSPVSVCVGGVPESPVVGRWWNRVGAVAASKRKIQSGRGTWEEWVLCTTLYVAVAACKVLAGARMNEATASGRSPCES